MKRTCLVFAIFASTAQCFAEPSPLVARFMSEPVNLFDLGLYRTDLAMDRAAEALGASMGSAKYSWAKNEIRLVVLYIANQASALCSTNQSCKNACEAKLKELGGRFYIPYGNRGEAADLFTGKFTHLGYSVSNFYRGKDSEEAAKMLLDITTIDVGIYSASNENVFCSRDLKGGRISFSTAPPE